MTCANCNKEIPDNFKFCCFCGAEQIAKCTVCGADLYDGASFCGKCGTRIVESAPETEYFEIDYGEIIEVVTFCNMASTDNWLDKNVDLAKFYNIDWISRFYGDYAIAHIQSKDLATDYVCPDLQ